MIRRHRWLVCVAVVLLSCSGCVREDVSGSTVTCTNELWVPLVVFLGGLVAGPVGWYLRDRSARFGWGLLILSPVVIVGFVPSLLMDKAIVDDTHFSLRTGIWGLTAVHDVKYSELSSVSLISEEKRGRYGAKNTSYYLMCQRKDGSSSKVPLGNKVAETAAPYFLHHVQELKIPVIDQTGENLL
ncbi:MAG: hypothetical protein JSS02_13530 [Planctomycetes bacterium]|nr:hypothetical protein [Planctomycetota bacterium]